MSFHFEMTSWLICRLPDGYFVLAGYAKYRGEDEEEDASAPQVSWPLRSFDINTLSAIDEHGIKYVLKTPNPGEPDSRVTGVLRSWKQVFDYCNEDDHDLANIAELARGILAAGPVAGRA